MPSRRDLLAGAVMVASAAGAQALIPRRQLTLLGGLKLEDAVPRALPGWQVAGTGGVVSPPPKGSLADRLYSQTAQRVFVNGAGEVVMLLIAYGDSQSDQLSLHRPESCYPAVGFQIGNIREAALRLPPSSEVPVRALSARLDQRVEQILYWTRVGEHLPNSPAEQRRVRIENALAGVVTDGVLVRVSTLSDEVSKGTTVNEAFARTFLQASNPMLRRALLGSRFSSSA